MFYRVYDEEWRFYGEYFSKQEAENKISALEEEWRREWDNFFEDYYVIVETDEEYDGTN